VLHKVTVRTAPVLVFPSLVSLVCVDCLNDTTAYPYKRRDYVSPLPFSQESLPQLKALHANLCVDLFVQFTHLDMLQLPYTNARDHLPTLLQHQYPILITLDTSDAASLASEPSPIWQHPQIEVGTSTALRNIPQPPMTR
jgi:hypothetical protein